MGDSRFDAGYSAAIGDAVAVLDSLRAPGQETVSGPILLRIRARLLDLLEAERRQAG